MGCSKGKWVFKENPKQEREEIVRAVAASSRGQAAPAVTDGGPQPLLMPSWTENYLSHPQPMNVFPVLGHCFSWSANFLAAVRYPPPSMVGSQTTHGLIPMSPISPACTNLRHKHTEINRKAYTCRKSAQESRLGTDLGGEMIITSRSWKGLQGVWN